MKEADTSDWDYSQQHVWEPLFHSRELMLTFKDSSRDEGERSLQNTSHIGDFHSKAEEGCIYVSSEVTVEAVSNWKMNHDKHNVQIKWKKSSLICKR